MNNEDKQKVKALLKAQCEQLDIFEPEFRRRISNLNKLIKEIYRYVFPEEYDILDS